MTIGEARSSMQFNPPPPTVGRVVHYYTRLGDQRSDDGREGPYAAMVTKVWGPTVVDLMVVPNGREGYHAMAVRRDMRQNSGFFCWWEWPPLV